MLLNKPVVNDMLTKFTNASINHKMRTTSNKSPLQLYIMDMQQIQHENSTIANQYFKNLSEVSFKIYLGACSLKLKPKYSLKLMVWTQHV